MHVNILCFIKPIKTLNDVNLVGGFLAVLERENRAFLLRT